MNLLVEFAVTLVWLYSLLGLVCVVFWGLFVFFLAVVGLCLGLGLFSCTS